MTFLRALVVIIVAAVVAGCTTSTTQEVDAQGNVTQAFRIRPAMVDDIRERHLETINVLRTAQGLPGLEYSAELDAAAQRHASSILSQQRAWHFGLDGSSPIDRVSQAGFVGRLVGENVSESYENDQITLQAWLRDPNSRAIILDPNARFIGFGWAQEDNAKLWWVQVLGAGSGLNPDQSS